MKAILKKLSEHERLTREEAKSILVNISNGAYNNAQIAAFITVYLMRAITVEELSGFRDALLDLCVRVDFEGQETIDMCGTGGDGKNTFNISTLASFVVAGAGYKVSKHGNSSVSSACGSSDVLKYFGYEFTNDIDTLKNQLDQSNITFMHAPLFHPAMKSVGPVRKELGMKTFFNMLGPIVNPCSPSHQFVGVFSRELARLYQYIFQQDSKKQYSVVHSLDGYDEISLTGKFQLKGNHEERLLSPEDLALNKLNPVDLFGGDTVEEAAKIFKAVLEVEGTQAQQEVVIANAGAAIRCLQPEKSILDCVSEARESLVSKKALETFKRLTLN
ncbi:MAG: anthranilate phosphoribosyltransferase [Bacteroidota bacterium]